MEKSRFTRSVVKLLLIIITVWILTWPYIRRPENLLLSGREPYYHLQEGTLSFILSFLNHYTGVSIILLAKAVPVILGVLCILLFYEVLRKAKLNYGLVLLSSLILIISPSFIYLFGTLNAYAFTSVLFLLAFHLFLEKKEVLGLMMFYLIPFFGPISAIIALLLLLIYSLKNKKFRLFLIALPSLIMIYLLPTRILPSYNNIIISDFGGRYGLGIFIILLSLFGLKYLWDKKYRHLLIYLIILSLCAFSFFDVKALAFLNFILVGLAALGLISLSKEEWKSVLIKQLTLLIMIYGLIFSGLSYINFLSQDLPNQEILDMIEYLKTVPEGRVFSHGSREPWIEYSGKTFVTDKNLFYTNKIDQAMATINSKKIRYLWIDSEMETKIWGGEEQGLLFLLEYSKNFRKNKINDYVTLWEVVENP